MTQLPACHLQIVKNSHLLRIESLHIFDSLSERLAAFGYGEGLEDAFVVELGGHEPVDSSLEETLLLILIYHNFIAL